MNNKLASEIRDYGMNRVFDGMDFSEMIQIDSGKFVFPLDIDGNVFYCEVDFVAKKEDYTPDRDVRLYQEKCSKAVEREREKAAKKAEKQNKSSKTEKVE